MCGSGSDWVDIGLICLGFLFLLLDFSGVRFFSLGEFSSLTKGGCFECLLSLLVKISETL